MVSAASCWRDGRQLWKVTHDAQDPLGLEHLAIEGAPPPELTRIHTEALQELRADPDPCDYLFDVPVNLAAEVVGFRHDEGDYQFEELRPA